MEEKLFALINQTNIPVSILKDPFIQESSLLELLPAAVYVCESSGVIQMYNKRAVSLWGRKPKAGDTDEKFCGAFKLYYPDGTHLPHECNPVAKVLEDGNPRHNMEVIIEREDNSRIIALVNVVPIKDREGKIHGAINCFQDITKLKELEKLKDDFIGVASHELKTPIASQKIYLQLLKNRLDEKEDPNLLRLHNKITAQTAKIEKLIEELLNVSRIEVGKFNFMVGETDINVLARNAVEDLQPMAHQHKLVIKGHIRQKVLADANKISQVFVNLLSNAIKYSPQANEVVIELLEKKDEVMVKVTDHGIGIDSIHLTDVFSRFFRISGHSEDTYPGMGIGLYISAEIIKLHDGKMAVESEKGKGSVFYFTLPLMKTP